MDIDVLSLMKHHFYRDAALLQFPEERHALVGLDVPVIDAMYDEHRGFDFIHQIQIVSFVPKTIVVAGGAVLSAYKRRERRVIGLLDLRVILCVLGSAKTIFCQNIQVVTLPAHRRKVQPADTIIRVPVGNRRLWNDGL